MGGPGMSRKEEEEEEEETRREGRIYAKPATASGSIVNGNPASKVPTFLSDR